MSWHNSTETYGKCLRSKLQNNFEKAQMFFVSLSNDARIFTSFSHEMSLWSGATWPTVFTRNREDYYTGIGANPPLFPPRVPFVPATGLSVVSGPPRRQMSSGSRLQVYPAGLSSSRTWKIALMHTSSFLVATMKLLGPCICHLCDWVHFALPLSG